MDEIMDIINMDIDIFRDKIKEIGDKQNIYLLEILQYNKYLYKDFISLENTKIDNYITDTSMFDKLMYQVNNWIKTGKIGGMIQLVSDKEEFKNTIIMLSDIHVYCEEMQMDDLYEITNSYLILDCPTSQYLSDYLESI